VGASALRHANLTTALQLKQSLIMRLSTTVHHEKMFEDKQMRFSGSSAIAEERDLASSGSEILGSNDATAAPQVR
jgi:hypothetical protein